MNDQQHRSPKAQPRERNNHLHEAMMHCGVGFAELADTAGVDVKTAQRWVNEGRLPSGDRANKIAARLGLPAHHLFPPLRVPLSHPDLIDLYQDIDDVSEFLWRDLARTTPGPVHIACATPPMLPAGIGKILSRRATADRLTVWLAIGNDSRAVLSSPGIEVRRCPGSPMSLYRFGSHLLAWLNRGAPGAPQLGPVLHLHHQSTAGIFTAYAQMLIRLWAEATPIDADPIAADPIRDTLPTPDHG